MLRSLALVSLLILLHMVPAAAQQLTEQQARQAVQSSLYDIIQKSAQAKDAATQAALYTEDALRVSPTGDTLVGRAAIEKYYTKTFQSFDEDPFTVDHVKVLTNDVVLAEGSWSGTWHGPDGPVHMAGRWANTDVRVGDTWRIAAQIISMLPNK